MKSSTAINLLVLSFILMVGLNACKKKCKDEQPQARIINNTTQKASVQIKTSDGNTVNINNVDPGTSSSYSNYAAGTITFTLTLKTVNYVETVQMNNCYNYDIAIDANYVVKTTAVDRNN